MYWIETNDFLWVWLNEKNCLSSLIIYKKLINVNVEYYQII